MKKSLLPLGTFCLLLAFTACQEPTKTKEPTAPPVIENQRSLSVFTDTLAKLDQNKPGAIDSALQLYSVLVPFDSTSADSAASALVQFVQTIVDRRNDSLFRDTTDYSPLLYPASVTLTEKQKALQTRLHIARLKPVSDGEGSVYLTPLYETILPGIKDRTSEPVDLYLDLSAKEDTTPVFMDAGLAIELPELADRLVSSERLLSKKLPQNFSKGAEKLNRFYTHAMLLGADNSPALVYDSVQLNEVYRRGYDYLLAKYPASKAAAKINVWLAVVASGDKRKVDDFIRTVQ